MRFDDGRAQVFRQPVAVSTNGPGDELGHPASTVRHSFHPAVRTRPQQRWLARGGVRTGIRQDPLSVAQRWNKGAWKYPFKGAVIAAELPAAATA